MLYVVGPTLKGLTMRIISTIRRALNVLRKASSLGRRRITVTAAVYFVAAAVALLDEHALWAVYICLAAAACNRNYR
jgi:hypothetical protein